MYPTKHRLLDAACSFFLGLLLSTPPFLQAQKTETQHIDSGSTRMLQSSDAGFAIQAAQGGLAEVKLGKFAAAKAENSDVKAFGQQMIEDHTKANNQLKAVAQAEDMTLPADVNSAQQDMYDKLLKLSGPEFDKACLKGMLKDHEEDVKKFAREAKSGTDPQMKSFAAETLPIIQGHLEKVKAIKSQVSGK